MCIIVCKPGDHPIPEDDILSECWSHNNDGAGYMYPREGSVHINKGFMKLQSLVKSLKGLPGDIKNGPIIIHFRKATHGNRDGGNTHPFPVCGDYNAMRKTRNVCDIAVTHNGVLSITPEEKQASDTMAFIKHVIHENPTWLFDSVRPVVFDMAIGSNKFATMTGAGRIIKIGSFTDDDGISYSNTTYKRSQYTSVGFGRNNNNVWRCTTCTHHRLGAYQWAEQCKGCTWSNEWKNYKRGDPKATTQSDTKTPTSEEVAEQFQEAFNEWEDRINNDVPPRQLPSSNQRVWRKCATCFIQWDKIQRRECPLCGDEGTLVFSTPHKDADVCRLDGMRVTESDEAVAEALAATL